MSRESNQSEGSPIIPPKKTQFSAVGVLVGLLVIVILAIALISIACLLTPEPRITAGSEIVTRDIHLVLDQTGSLNDEGNRGRIDSIKSLVKREVIGNVSLGDRIFIYQISSIFDENSDCFCRPELPTVPENVVGAELSKYPPDLVDTLASKWARFNRQKKS